MRLRVAFALVGVLGFAYALFFVLSSMEGQGASSFGLANEVGLVAVFFGLIAAGFLFRRARPPG